MVGAGDGTKTWILSLMVKGKTTIIKISKEAGGAGEGRAVFPLYTQVCRIHPRAWKYVNPQKIVAVV